MKLLTALFSIVLPAGCLTTPNPDTGEGYWRYGIAEDNTGRLTGYGNVQDIPVIRLSDKEFLIICKSRHLSWACYSPSDDVIYLASYHGGKFEIIHEQGHAVLGVKHNECNGRGYAPFGDYEYACLWDEIP